MPLILIRQDYRNQISPKLQICFFSSCYHQNTSSKKDPIDNFKLVEEHSSAEAFGSFPKISDYLGTPNAQLILIQFHFQIQIFS